MPDRITTVLKNYIAELRARTEMMERGELLTHTNHEDTTAEGIARNLEWIAELESALARHEARNA